MRSLLRTCNHSDAKGRMYLVYLKYWTLNPMPLMVYPKVLIHPNVASKCNSTCHDTQAVTEDAAIPVSHPLRIQSFQAPIAIERG